MKLTEIAKTGQYGVSCNVTLTTYDTQNVGEKRKENNPYKF